MQLSFSRFILFKATKCFCFSWFFNSVLNSQRENHVQSFKFTTGAVFLSWIGKTAQKQLAFEPVAILVQHCCFRSLQILRMRMSPVPTMQNNFEQNALLVLSNYCEHCLQKKIVLSFFSFTVPFFMDITSLEYITWNWNCGPPKEVQLHQLSYANHWWKCPWLSVLIGFQYSSYNRNTYQSDNTLQSQLICCMYTSKRQINSNLCKMQNILHWHFYIAIKVKWEEKTFLFGYYVVWLFFGLIWVYLFLCYIWP